MFVGLPPQPAPPVEPPAGADARAATRAAVDSTVEVLGRGCYQGFLNQGSGFVVADGYVITNAHVVAGTNEQWVHSNEGDTAAAVVVFDPDLDIAVLHAPGLSADPLPLARGEVGRGAGGAILGYPGGGPLDAESAAVRQVIEPVGRNIYGEGEVRRRVYEVQSVIRRGNSGGPLVLAGRPGRRGRLRELGGGRRRGLCDRVDRGAADREGSEGQRRTGRHRLVHQLTARWPQRALGLDVR